MSYSNNKLQTFQDCARKYQYAYIDGMEPRARKSAALDFGTAWHQVMECTARKQPLELQLAACQNPDPFVEVTLRALLLGYVTLWKDDAAEYEPIEVEGAFELPFNDTSINGRMDALVWDKQGRVWVVERKTTSTDLGDEAYWRHLRLDPQISMYFRAARKLGHEPYGCLYDVVRKPTIEPLKATPVEDRKYTKTTKNEPSRLYANQREEDEGVFNYFERLVADIGTDPGKYYRRATVYRDAQDEFEAHLDTSQTIDAITHATARGAFPRNPGACKKWGSVCGYFPVCIREAELADTTLYQPRKKAS